MKSRWSYALVLTLLTPRSALPDTITMNDSLSIRGALLGMSNGRLRMKSRFPSGEKEVWVQTKDVQSIEFNSNTFNPGPPPKILGFGPPSPSQEAQKESPVEDVIVLRGGLRQSCILLGIDADRVHCGPKDTGYNRNTVLRIVFGSK